MYGDAMYRVTRRLELTRCMLWCGNQVEVGNIFRRLEDMEASIIELLLREDRDGGLFEEDLADLQEKLFIHHSLL